MIYHCVLPLTSLLTILLLLTGLTNITESTETYSSPQFTAQPTDIIVAEGQSAVLQCVVTGQPPPSIAWFKEEGGEVTPEDDDRYSISTSSGELIITNVMPSDAGEYYCVVSNAVGSVRSLTTSLETAVFVTTGLPPENSAPLPELVTNRLGITLRCTVPHSIPSATIQWEKNSVLLDQSDFTSNGMGITLAGDLVISSVNIAIDTGRYNCYAINDVIGIESRVFTSGYILFDGGSTQPLSIPTVFVTTPTSQSVVIGDSAHFDCFTTGTPVAEISWTKDGSPLTSSSMNHITFTQTQRVLTISPVTENDAGSYTCIATVPSLESSVESEAARLTVIVPPMMETSLVAVAVNITEEVILVCEVVASDNGTYVEWEWRVNSSEVVTSGNVLYDRSGLMSQLQIVSVTEDDRGVYQCVASLVVDGVNLGQAAANDRLTVVLTPPSLTSQPSSDLLIFQGSTVSLPCTATGFPPPQFTWLIGNGIIINLQDSRFTIPPLGSGDGTLTISDVVIADSSVYQCQATNSAGSDTSDTIQLRILMMSQVLGTPEDLLTSLDNVYTADHGSTVSVPCHVTRNDGTTFAYTWYRDGTEVDRITGTGMGTLMLEGVMDNDRGRYECVVEITASGVGGQPLEEIIGAVTIGVGDLPTNPSPPTSLLVTMVTSNTLTLNWTMPSFNGNLPLTKYTVEVLLLGNQLCPQLEPEWKVHQIVDDGNAMSTIVSDLIPYQEYHIRLSANNSAYQSDHSLLTQSISTLIDVPSSPPSNVVATVDGLQRITVSWEPPTDCLSFGGVITDYSVCYRKSLESTFVTKMVGSNKTSLILTSLTSQTMYTITVSAHTEKGAGPPTEPVEVATLECSAPAPPTNLETNAINTTAVNISWDTPTDPDELYIITWCHGNQDTPSSKLIQGYNSILITGLEPGQDCVVMITVNNLCGNEEVQITVAPAITVVDTVKGSIIGQQWFIAVIAVVGTLLVFGIPTLAIFFICFKCRRQEGKIYITSRRSASSCSGVSNAFTEYQQKHKKVARATGITVHSDPPPQRRSTDYADLGSYNSHISSTTPSISSYQRNMTAEVNGGPSQHNSEHNIPPSDTSQIDTMIRHETPENFDHLGVINLPPGGDSRFNRTHHHRVSSPESTDSWSAAESLSYRGHMTGHVTGHVTESDGGSNRGSAGNVRGEWSAVGSNHLSPVHENQIMESSSHVHHNWQPARRETVAMGNNHSAQHSSQPVLLHDHSPSPPPLPTSLPPPLSSLHLPPQHTQSMDQMLNPHTHMESKHNRTGMGPTSHSHTQFQYPQSRPGIQNGFSHPALPSSNDPRSSSPEYAEPKQVARKHKENIQRKRHEHSHQQKMMAVPLKSKSKHFSSSKSKKLSSAPTILSPSSDQELVEMSAQPRPVAAPKPPPPVKTKHFGRSTSEQQTTGYPPTSHPRSMSLEQEPAQTTSTIHSHELKDVLTQWKNQQEIKEREREMAGLKHKGPSSKHNGYPHPRQPTNTAMGYPNPTGSLVDTPNGLPNGYSQSSVPSSEPSSRPSVSSHNERWTTTPSPQPQGITNPIQNAETPIVKNAPPVFIAPPNNHISTNKHHHNNTTSHQNHAPRKNHHELEDIYQSDPRKPKRRKGRVPGAVWKQMPMNSRIESSSSESDLSSDSDNASLTSEYV